MDRFEMLKRGADEAVNLERPTDWAPLLYYIDASRLVIGAIIGYVIGIFTGGLLMWLIFELF